MLTSSTLLRSGQPDVHVNQTHTSIHSRRSSDRIEGVSWIGRRLRSGTFTGSRSLTSSRNLRQRAPTEGDCISRYFCYQLLFLLLFPLQTFAWIDGTHLLPNVQPVQPKIPATAPTQLRPPKIGDQRTFYAVEFRNKDQYRLNATLRAIGTWCYIYVENTESGLKLYDCLFEIGKEFNVQPGCPNLIERIESGLISYGNDVDNNDNPLECGFDKFVNLDSDVKFLGKEKLKKIKSEGINKKIMGVQIETNKINMTGSLDLKNEKNEKIGELRSACYSPKFKKVIGIAMMQKQFWNNSQSFKIDINGDTFSGKVCDLPLS